MTAPPGSADDRPLPEIFASLAQSSFSGVLSSEREGRRYAIFFSDGAVVDADSPVPEDQLGRVLLAAGILTSAQVGEMVTRLARSPGKRALDVLVEMEALQRDSLERAATMGLAKRAIRAFSLAGTTFHVDEQAHARQSGGPFDARWLLYRGLRQFYDEARLLRELERLSGQAMKRLGDAESLLEPFGFGEAEHACIAYLQRGYWEAQDLADACAAAPREVVLSVVHALVLFGALDLQPADQVPRLRRKGAASAPRPPAPAVVTSTRPTPSAIKQGAPQPTSQAAPPPPGGPSAPSPPSRSTAAAVTPPAVTAPSVSRPTAAPSMQAPHVSTVPPGLREQMLRKFAAVEAGADCFAVLEIDRHASKEQVKAAYFQLAKTYHPDRLAIVKLDDLRPQVERIFVRLSEAFATLGDDARKKEYLTILGQGGEAVVKQRESDEAARAMKILSAEEQFRIGEMALRRQLWPQALEAFKKALELNPDEGEHHAMHAWATWCVAPDKDKVLVEVRKGLHKAIELNPQCAQAFFYTGQVFKHSGDLERASAHFQKALDLQPSHVEAEREVRLMEMRRAKGEKKGLFDKLRKK
ncbi:MAG: DnaJ domain-containing protein [Deltaproteobacteria bacterium]|nr:DnaJ domain-containing protein [Deltaproteobacteria bacterium]